MSYLHPPPPLNFRSGYAPGTVNSYCRVEDSFSGCYTYSSSYLLRLLHTGALTSIVLPGMQSQTSGIKEKMFMRRGVHLELQQHTFIKELTCKND